MQKTPFVLLPFQKEWLSKDAPVKIWEKSRRIGASWTEAGEASLVAASADGSDVWYIGYNQDMAGEFIRDAADWARIYNLAAGEVEEELFEDSEDRSIKSFKIQFASGHRVTALSSRPTNLRGKQGIVIIDEAAFHEDLRGLIKAAIALLMWGGKVRILSSHNGIDNYFNELIQDCRKGKKPYWVHRTDLDTALEEGLYKRICYRLGKKYSKKAQEAWREELVETYGDDAEEELFCNPSASGANYFSRALLESNMSAECPILKLALQQNFATQPEEYRRSYVEEWCEENLGPILSSLDRFLKTSYGFDFGRSGDLSYLTILQELPSLVRKTVVALELRNIPFEQQRQILFYCIDRLPRFIGGAHDSRGNGQYLGEVAAQRYGFYRIKQVMLSSGWYLENFPRYKAAHEDHQIILPANSDLLDDHRQVVVERGIPKIPDTKRSKGTDGGQRHGDGAIAYCLGWFASCGEEVAFSAIGSSEYDNY